MIHQAQAQQALQIQQAPPPQNQSNNGYTLMHAVVAGLALTGAVTSGIFANQQPKFSLAHLPKDSFREGIQVPRARELFDPRKTQVFTDTVKSLHKSHIQKSLQGNQETNPAQQSMFEYALPDGNGSLSQVTVGVSDLAYLQNYPYNNHIEHVITTFENLIKNKKFDYTNLTETLQALYQKIPQQMEHLGIQFVDQSYVFEDKSPDYTELAVAAYRPNKDKNILNILSPHERALAHCFSKKNPIVARSYTETYDINVCDQAYQSVINQRALRIPEIQNSNIAQSLSPEGPQYILGATKNLIDGSQQLPLILGCFLNLPEKNTNINTQTWLPLNIRQEKDYSGHISSLPAQLYLRNDSSSDDDGYQCATVEALAGVTKKQVDDASNMAHFVSKKFTFLIDSIARNITNTIANQQLNETGLAVENYLKDQKQIADILKKLKQDMELAISMGAISVLSGGLLLGMLLYRSAH